MNSDNLNRKIARSLKTMTASSAIVFVLQFVTTIILARIFSPTEFGIVAAIMVIVSFTDIFWQAGVGPSLVQKKLLNKEDISTAHMTSVAFGILATLVIILSSPLLIQVINIDEKVYLNVIALSFIINSFGVVRQSLIQREMKFRYIVRKDIFSNLTYTTIAIIFGLLGMGIWALIIAIVSRYIVSVIILWKGYPTKLHFGFNKSSFKEMFIFGGGVTLSRIFNTTANQGDYLVITQTLGVHSLGIYNKSYQLVAAPANIVGQVVDQVFFPAMASIQDDDSKLSKMHTAVVSILALVYFPIGIILFFFSDEIIGLLLGDGWLEASIPFGILAIFVFFRVVYKISDPLCRAKGAVYKRAFVQMIYAISVILFAYIGSFFGLVGVSIGVGLALFLNYICITVLVYKLINFNIKDYLINVVPIFVLAAFNIIIIDFLISFSSDFSPFYIILYKLTVIIFMQVFTIFIAYRFIWSKDISRLVKKQIISLIK